MGFYIVQFLTGLSDASSLFLIASGLSLIFGVTRIVNFAHGSFYMVGAYVAYSFISFLPQNFYFFWIGVLGAALVVGVLGVFVEISLLRRLYHVPELFLLMATFGIVLILQDGTRWIFGAEDLLGPRAPGIDGSVNIMGSLIPQYDLVLIVIAPLVLGGIWLMFHRTRWGVLVRAATEDREMVSFLGVNQARLYTGVFFLGSFLAGLGGAIQLPKGGADLLMDMNVIAAAFVIVVVGGMGSIIGAYVAYSFISFLPQNFYFFWIGVLGAALVVGVLG
ncbi:MAG: branched-chain amino acid ABC transporter permease, partial [Deltaproteobacteria bacterium]|nr:branched-chain amino acid ABC transporter permease [Deltaproteobacteria bacterium]